MPEVVQNTLYVTTEGAYVHRDGLLLKVEIEKETRLAVPIHHLQSVVVFGHSLVSPGALALCAEHGVPVSYLSLHGRLVARVDAPASGNVLLRREQFRWADDPDRCREISRAIVAGKVQNARTLLLRAAREAADAGDAEALRSAADLLGGTIRDLGRAATLDEVRGIEGDAARRYFEAFPRMIRVRDGFPMAGRSRRPPLDPVNALLSFLYAILVHDCAAALTCAGLDPSVGFLHVDRPGRPSLALDLMEEFRPLIADRLVLALINRRQVAPAGFAVREGGAVEMDEKTRKAVLAAYQERKQEEVRHPLLDQKTRVGMLPFIQARLLARCIRGDIPVYPPCVLR